MLGWHSWDGKLGWTTIVTVVTVMVITCMNHGWPDMKECFRADMKSEDLLGSWTWLGLLGFAAGRNHGMWICDRSSWWEGLGVEYKKMSQDAWDTLLYFITGVTLRRIVLNTFATSISHCYSFCSLRWGMWCRRELRTKRRTKRSHWSMGHQQCLLR